MRNEQISLNLNDEVELWKKAIGNSINYIRKSKKISYRKMSEGTGIDHANIYRIEKGGQIPTHGGIVKICNLFDYTIAQFWAIAELEFNALRNLKGDK